MKKWTIVLSLLLCLICFAGTSNALLVNGGFETGNLTGWNHSKNVNVQTHDVFGNFSAYEGKYMAVLATGIGVFDASLGQDFNADSYDGFTLSFAYNLQALDLSKWWDPTNGDTLTATISASIGSDLLLSHVINDPFDKETSILGWQVFSQTFSMPSGPLGPITLNFDLENFPGGGGDWTQETAAYIDAVSIKPFNPVPEPATMLLLGTGLIGIAGLGRKKLKK